MQAVPEPAGADVGESDPVDMFGGVADLVRQAGLDPVQGAGDDGAGGLPDDAEDGEGDQEADDRIRQREPGPHAERAQHDSETGQTVGPGVVTVGNEGRALDLAPDPDAED